MDYILLGTNIANERIKQGLTQEYLAEKAEISTVFISHIETAKRKPSLETVVKIASILGTSVDKLVGNLSDATRYSELLALLEQKNGTEVKFITSIVKELCNGISKGRIISK